MNLKTDRNCHSLYNLQYHLILVTKYRKKCINEDVFAILKDQIAKVLKMNGACLEEINYEALAELTGLLSLDLERNYNNGEYNSQIKDLSFLTGMRQLESLTLSGVNDVAQLEYIKQLPNLRQLYLYDCRACNDAVAMRSLIQALPPNCSVSYY